MQCCASVFGSFVLHVGSTSEQQLDNAEVAREARQVQGCATCCVLAVHIGPKAGSEEKVHGAGMALSARQRQWRAAGPGGALHIAPGAEEAAEELSFAASAGVGERREAFRIYSANVHRPLLGVEDGLQALRAAQLGRAAERQAEVEVVACGLGRRHA